MKAVYERMPDKIRRLPEIAYNLWWSWHPDARELFRSLDLPLWKKTEHNPVRLLQEIEQENLEAAAKSALFVRHYDKVLMDFDRELANGHSWFKQEHGDLGDKTIAYFSAEFGIHNSLPIYSGGLGILSGDHAKEASDLGIPLVGVGFMYPQGYFRQQVPSHGWQEAVYEQLDMGQAPIRPVHGENGHELIISTRMGDRQVHARVWHVQVGRVPLYLLDTDVDENDPWDRELSARLYSGDIELRIRQEIMLGIGGVRALRSLGINPDFWHINEGHSAFLGLECIRELVAEGMSFEQARAEFRKRSLFTTHTPVPAGHDAFTFHVIETYFAGYWQELGLSREQFFDLGKHEEDWGTSFNMTVLAFRLNGRANGVSKLHGQVSREMWQGVWPEKPALETPISHVTNGIHVPTWAPPEYHQLLAKYLGPDWVERHDNPTIWERIEEIPAGELWEHHLNLKRKMIGYLRERSRRRWVADRADPTQVLTSGTMLDPEALTIGFARRFATYKRATLIFRDIDRLKEILLDIHRPVQLLFAGKAHPADDPGKMLIQNVYNLAKHNRLGGRVAFVEDYDMHMARYLVQGVDVWLNTPRRPREASGTSGQKAALNGVPNLSIMDGWWAEAYNGVNGWAIGLGAEYDDQVKQDEEDAKSLYEILEDEIVPLYYDRDRDQIPRGWVEIMRESIKSNAPFFSTRRMVKEYAEIYVDTIRSNGTQS
ncbi:MAG TPA: alpha-glucan family phosphorylase [candidate division Zixibacteria bacterium]|nr:alpha-glucan family phosphorylase [candidate division Zixibacteria bacterium]